MPRTIATLQPTADAPSPPSLVYTFVMTGGSSAQASDWFNDSGVAAANAAAAGIHLVRITPVSTAGGAFFCTANLLSTAVTVPSSSITFSSTSEVPVLSPREFQIPGGSTGFSLAAYTSGVVMVECWKK